MRAKFILSLMLVMVFIIVYLNRSYANFFHTIGQMREPAVWAFSQRYTFTNPHSQQSRTFVYAALGDSLTAGVGVKNINDTYAYTIIQSLLAKYKNVVFTNLSVPGARSDQIVSDQIPIIKGIKPDLITVMAGINDLLQDESSSQFRSSFDPMLTQLDGYRGRVAVINIAYFGPSQTLVFPYNLVLDWRIRQFNRIIASLVKKHNFYYIDLYAKTRSLNEATGYYSKDQFHPGPQGYKRWGEIIDADISTGSKNANNSF